METLSTSKILKFLPILLIAFSILSINSVSANTYYYTYNDPSLRNPPGCTGVAGNFCSDTGDRAIFATMNYDPNWNHTNQNISMNLTVSYNICTMSASCFDGNSTAVYGGNSKLVFNTTDLLNELYLTDEGGNNYTVDSCNSSTCSYADNRLKSGQTLTWVEGLTGAVPTIPTQTKNYTLKSIFTPGISTSGYSSPINLQSTIATNTMLMTFDVAQACPVETVATIACGNAYYFQPKNSSTQYTTGNIYNGKVISSFVCQPNNYFGSPATATVNFIQQTPCIGGGTPLLKLK